LRRLVLLSIVLLAGAGGAASGGSSSRAGGNVELVVALQQPPLARAVGQDRALAAVATRRRRLDLRAPAAVSYLRRLASAQRSLAARIVEAIPGARVRWRYQVVTDGLAVVVPRSQVAKLSRLRGVAQVYPTVTYHANVNRSPDTVGAPAVWGSALQTAGQGMKIGIIDEGVDQTHPYFSPNGFTMPPGFPKGDLRYTTAKVIVARAFAPAEPKWKYASLPFDPQNSEHGTHVAGIAAGDLGVYKNLNLSGIAPDAYIGNYKALSVPTPDFGLDGNSPEIAAAIEAAVRDGMDVINLSLGEPEIEPSRDLVVEAIDAAADAGVVPVIAAGNDFQEFGRGSVGSPGTAPKAITVAASTYADEIADFSSSGPTPISLQLKPDVTCPGVAVVSSLPARQSPTLLGTLDGTSMATPCAAGAAALLKQRHPGWTVAQIKSALTQTGDPVHPLRSNGEVATTREGGGLIDLPRADNPLVFAEPNTLSFGLVRVGASAVRTVSLADAGGGPGTWSVSTQVQDGGSGGVTTPATVDVPGPLAVTAKAGAAESDTTGFVVLTHGSDVRRIPFWFRVEQPRLGSEPATLLRAPGVYQGDTAGKLSLVTGYRYPDATVSSSISPAFAGPEQVFRVHLTRPAANFGVAVIGHAAGVGVEPRIVIGGDENRLTGYTGLPLDLNPYRSSFGKGIPVVAAILPAPGDYDVVFDTPTLRRPGRFTFRFWVNDKSPPTARLLSRVPRGGWLRVALADAGSGVDPNSVEATVDGRPRSAVYERGVLRVEVRGIPRGPHRLRLTVADRQEAKNMEDVGPILPNTRVLTAAFAVR